MSLQLFVDFWNLTLQWRDRAGEARLDWVALPRVLQAEAERVGALEAQAFTGIRVYASTDKADPRSGNLRGWLDRFLDRQPGFKVSVRERRSHRRPIHCRECNAFTEDCPACGKPFCVSVEKGVDSAIVTDMISLAWEEAYDVAVLVSSDGDFVPAVERLQEKGIKVINATWSGHGHQLAKTCWASFEIDALIPGLIRGGPA
jgi:uncharacterized LabA/DUF88 family protein